MHFVLQKKSFSRLTTTGTGLFPFDELLTFYKFEDFAQALQDLKDGKVVKPVLVM